MDVILCYICLGESSSQLEEKGLGIISLCVSREKCVYLCVPTHVNIWHVTLSYSMICQGLIEKRHSTQHLKPQLPSNLFDTTFSSNGAAFMLLVV